MLDTEFDECLDEEHLQPIVTAIGPDGLDMVRYFVGSGLTLVAISFWPMIRPIADALSVISPL